MTEDPLDQSERSSVLANREHEPDETHAEGYVRRYEHTPEYISERRDQQLRFLLALPVERFDVRAAKVAEVSVDTVQRWKREDAWFRGAYEHANAQVGAVIMDEVWRRAIIGWEEPVYQGGEVVGYVRKFDSRLLEKLAASHFPDFNSGKPQPEAEGRLRDVPEGSLVLSAEEAALLKPVLAKLKAQRALSAGDGE